MLILVTYNKFFPRLPRNEESFFILNGKNILILDNAFNPKSPENVNTDDLQWRKLMLYEDHEIDEIAVFAGKLESGALEIINIFLDHFPQEKLFFVLCDHGLAEKISLLKKRNVPSIRYFAFSDGHEVCDDAKMLMTRVFPFVYG